MIFLLLLVVSANAEIIISEEEQVIELGKHFPVPSEYESLPAVTETVRVDVTRVSVRETKEDGLVADYIIQWNAAEKNIPVSCRLSAPLYEKFVRFMKALNGQITQVSYTDRYVAGFGIAVVFDDNNVCIRLDELACAVAKALRK